MPKDLVIELLDQMVRGLYQHKEMLAAAYFATTNLHPGEVELVEEPIDDCFGGRRWYFRKQSQQEGQMCQGLNAQEHAEYIAAKELLAKYGVATIARIDLNIMNLAIENMARRNSALEKALSNLLTEFENIPDGEIVNVDAARAIMKETEIPENEQPAE